VEHRDVGPQRRDAVFGVDGRAGLADDLDVALAFEHVAQAVADHLVVVEQVDPDHLSFVPQPGRSAPGRRARTGRAVVPGWCKVPARTGPSALRAGRPG